eukprot:UN03926
MTAGERDDAIQGFWKNYYLAEAYYIYKFIHEFTHLPFVSQSTETTVQNGTDAFQLGCVL